MRHLSAIGLVLCLAATTDAQEPEWNPSSIRECDRACLVSVIDGYMNAMFTRDPKAVPTLATSYRMTENTAQMEVGEGVLWRSRTEPTTFKIFAYMKHIRPRRTLIVDEQKGLVGTFPLFVHDGTRRGAAPDAPPGMIQNLITMETFAIRNGLIHHVEVFPFFTLPYGMGNGWTPGSGR